MNSDFIIENGILTKYTGSGGAVVIPDGVTAIGRDAFSLLNSITSVHIPNSVTVIGHGAFESCMKLAHINIPDSVTAIHGKAFWNCPALADSDGFVIFRNTLYSYHGNGGDVVIPDGVTTISHDAFFRFKRRTCVRIPTSVTSIGWNAFIANSTIATIIAPHIAINRFVPNGEAAAARGFLLAYEQCADPEIFESYKAYLFKHRQKFLPKVISEDDAVALRFFARYGGITAENYESEYLTPALQAEAAQCVAFLLNWKNANLPFATDDLKL